MSTKAFVMLLVAVLILGGSLGGAFAGGVVLGKSQGEEVAQSSLPAQSTSNLGQQSSGQLGQEQLDQFRQQIQSGEFSQQDLDQFRQQFQGQFGQGFAGRGFAGGGGLSGTIEEIQGNTVTVNTSQGPLQATIGADTTIQMFTEGTLADLQAGLRVTVIGQRGEDGTVEARSILITPEGGDGVFEGGLFSGDRQQRDRQSP